MGNLGATEIMLILLVVLLFFGAKRIPEIARGMGKGIREFKDATNDIKRELTVDETVRRPGPPPQALPRYDQQVMTAGAPATGVYMDPAPAAEPAMAGPATASPAAPYTSGDAAANLPATGTTGAPYTPLDASDTPPPRANG